MQSDIEDRDLVWIVATSKMTVYSMMAMMMLWIEIQKGNFE